VKTPDWRSTAELVLLAFVAGWLCKWAHGHTGPQTPIDTAVLGICVGGVLGLSLVRPRE
jgi:uncharacterized membrane protein YeaQ/YmgE (transglycosylase-associated protein family)